MDIEIGDEHFTKKPGILEEIAYRDTWGRGTDSFLSMIYERMILMRDLLTDDGSIYVHCDWRVNGFIREVLDEVFGKERFVNEVIWFYPDSPGRPYDRFVPKHDNITRFSKTEKYIFNADAVRIPILEASKERYKTPRYLINSQGKRFEYTGGEAAENGKIPETVWQLSVVKGNSDEKVGYPTQKPESLLNRIIESSSNAGDLVADFFAGSGTLAAVAENLGRRWIATDLGKFAIHTTRKRMIGVQRQLKAEGKDYRAFEILNLGKYERRHYVGVNPNLREAEQQAQLAAKEAEFLALILRAYQAEKTDGFATFHGKKAGRMVSVGPVNLPVTRLYVEEVIAECRQKRISRADILGFEFEMGLFPNLLDEARAKGIDLSPKYIPAEVFDKRAVEKNQVRFHDVSYIEVKPHVGKSEAGLPTVAVELTDFSVYYSQNSVKQAEAALKPGGSSVVVEKGEIIKVSKDKSGVVTARAAYEKVV
jgi:site-specific DNA-methyltransferase (adenine-specific)/adenine-specific DNA-methyltransferase